MAGRRAGTGLALAAIALSAAGCGIGGSTKTVTSTVTHTHTVTVTRTVTQASGSGSACTGSQLTGTFDVVAGSEGAGQIAYALTLTNTSSHTCSVSSPPQVLLLSANGAPLATYLTSVYGTGPTVSLAPGGSAKAIARFSPDVPGSGDSQSGACQPKAHTLEVTPDGGGMVDAPITPPTSVCERGTLAFGPFSDG